MRKIIVFLLLFLSIQSFSQVQKPLDKQKYYSNKEIEEAVGYTQAIRVGTTLYVSGVPAKGATPEAIKSIYDRIEKILAAHGATFQHVVKETVFAVDLQDFIKHQDLRKPYFKGDYPAATWVEVRGLYLPEFKIEVEVIAELR